MPRMKQIVKPIHNGFLSFSKAEKNIYTMIRLKNIESVYALASCEYQMCIGEIDNIKALIKPTFLLKNNLPSLYIITIDNTPNNIGRDLKAISLSPKIFIQKKCKI
jgi:hypothetical protein